MIQETGEAFGEMGSEGQVMVIRRLLVAHGAPSPRVAEVHRPGGGDRQNEDGTDCE